VSIEKAKVGDIVLLEGKIVRRIVKTTPTRIYVYYDPANDDYSLIFYSRKDTSNKIITMAEASKLLQ